MPRPVLILLILLSAPGCGRPPGNGLWTIKVGAEARLVSPDGSDLTVEALAPATSGKSSRRKPAEARVETVTLAAGTRVVVLAIDSDDARVQVQDGPRAGSVYWLACARLEPAAN